MNGDTDLPHQGDLGSTGEFPPLDFTLTPEPLGDSSSEPLVEGVEVDFSLHLNTYVVRRRQAEIDDLSQAKIEREQLHELRTASTRQLFILTVVWVSVIWLIVLLQGFGQWFLPFSFPFSKINELKFKLSDAVVIAFITSTTATVLGLYGIAAYWLYGRKKQLEPVQPESKSVKSKKKKKSKG